jgi:adenylate kinase family enzyme
MARIVGRYDPAVSSSVVAQLPRDARRIVIRGTSGSGKTTMARRISAATGIPHVELDSVFHQRDWQPLSDEAFAAHVAAVAATDAWVVCGNYRQVAELLLARADTIVLYDLERRVVMSRILRRTIGRVARRTELWNGNRERWGNLFSTDPELSVVAWAWTTHAARRSWTAEFLARPPRDDLSLVHLMTPADERVLCAGLRAPDRHR